MLLSAWRHDGHHGAKCSWLVSREVHDSAIALVNDLA